MQAQPHEYIRTGQIPFFGLPRAPTDRGADTYRGQRAVVLGVPHDGGATAHRSARFAPYHVRRVSVAARDANGGADGLAAVAAVDGGNVIGPTLPAVEAALDRVLAAGAVPFCCGGDHAITLPILRAVARVHGPVALLHVDAHSGGRHRHGASIRRCLEEGLVAPGQLHQLGRRFRRRVSGTHAFTMDELEEHGVRGAMEQLREAIADHPVYLTFDIDALDPAFAPGTVAPVPGGLTTAEALALVAGLRGCRFVGMDVVEIQPALDRADLTCVLAARLLLEGLSLLRTRPS